MAWRALLALVTFLVAGCAASPTPGQDLATQASSSQAGADALAGVHPEPAFSWVPGISGFEILVGGEPARGLVAVPDQVPHTLVVVAHGLGGEAATHRADLDDLMRAGILAVAMDYRGEREAFKVRAGVEDTVAATLRLQQDFPLVERTLLYGWSMGGEVALLAAMEAPAGTYDYVFAGAGVMDLEMLWHETAWMRPAIEAETGGPPTEVPEEFTLRSPLRRAAELTPVGVGRVYLVHGAADSPVPVEHAERMFTALEDAGQPVSYYVVTKDRWQPCVPQGPCLDPVPMPAGHDAGRMQLMRPFLDNRIEGLPEPADPALRGTYDAASGKYDPKDTS